MEINKFHKLKYPLILASGSVFRLKLLNQILINPDLILAPNIDETKLKNESSANIQLELLMRKHWKFKKNIATFDDFSSYSHIQYPLEYIKE